MSLKKAAEAIRKNKRFLITAHVNLEGDALGSELAFMYLVRSLGKEAVVVNDDDLPYGYDSLPGIKQIKRYGASLPGAGFDAFVYLDCSDLSRAGNVHKLNKDRKTIINIDHHISNTGFGDVNWVEPKASSCCEVLYKLFKELGVKLDRNTATLLYVGILTDTGSFHYSNTTSFTHKVAAELLDLGVDVTGVYRDIYENKPFKDMMLLARMLTKIERDASGKIAFAQMQRDNVTAMSVSFDLSERVLSFLRTIKGVEVALLFKRIRGASAQVRVNFRSQGKIDVNKIAAFFGGGGHKTASGATVPGTLTEVKRKVLNKIKEYLK